MTDRTGPRQGSQRPIPQPLGVTPAPLRNLKDYVHQLYVEAGTPQTQHLAALIAEDDSLPGSPPKSTIHKIIGDTKLPTKQEDVVSVAVLLARMAGRHPDEVGRRVQRMWLAAHDTQPLGTPVRELDPFALEVHRAIDVPGQGALPRLPEYVPRDHDEQLSALVHRAAAGESLLVALVGESSTGKTRACWEALRELPDDWRVWHPYDPSRPDAALVHMAEAGPRTVIWLNEAQHYLLAPDRRTAEGITAALRTALADRRRGPLLVLATIWPRFWEPLTSPSAAGADDRFDQQRKLLTGTGHHILVPRTFTESDLREARRKAHHDPRLASALDGAAGGEITQFLAGVPKLMSRYECASLGAKALIHAAMDYRRRGHGPVLPPLLLAAAPAGYLAAWDLGRLGRGWLEKALDHCAEPCNGVPGPLTPVPPRSNPSGEPAYRLADYLEQHGRVERRLLCPPTSFWEAAARHGALTEDCVSLARAAQRRGRLYAASVLFEKALRAGNTEVRPELALLVKGAGDEKKAKLLLEAAWRDDGLARWELVWLREHSGEPGKAEELAHVAANQGDSSCLTRLARLRQEAGDKEGAQRLTRNAEERGKIRTYAALARFHEEAGDRPEAESLAFQVLNRTGSTYALSELVTMREKAGDGESAERLVVAAARRGRARPAIRLAGLRRRTGDRDGVGRLLDLAAGTGSVFALIELASLKRRWQDGTGAERLLRAAVARGSTPALVELARLRESLGYAEEALRLFRAAAERGSAPALNHLALLKEAAGESEEAERMACSAAVAGSTFALAQLMDRREQTGDREGAERLMRTACRVGDFGALVVLARRREKAGDRGGAEDLVLRAADAGHSQALSEFVLRRERNGDSDGAERLATAGGGPVVVHLARCWQSDGRTADAERLYRRAVDLGQTQALGELARLKEKAGEYGAAEEFARRAAHAGHVEVLSQLAQLRAQRGLTGDAERLHRAAADAGYEEALAHLAQLRKQCEADWEDLLRYGLTAEGELAKPW